MESEVSKGRPLSYAIRDTFRRRKRRQLLLVLTIVMAVALYACNFQARLGLQFRIWYLARQCAYHSEAPDAVDFDTAQGLTYVFNGVFQGHYSIPCLRQLKSIYRHEYSPVDKANIVFLHELYDGHKMIPVALYMEFASDNVDGWEKPLDTPKECQLAFYADLQLQKGDSDISCIWDSAPATNYLVIRRLKVFAGKLDPNDRRAFKVAFEADGVPGAIFGRIMDDGRVHLRVTGPNLNTLAVDFEHMPTDDPVGF